MSGNSETAQSSSHGWLAVVWDWTRSIFIAVGVALLVRWPILEPFKIPSGSMRPTLMEGDRIAVDKHVYGVRWPFNGFRFPMTTNTIWYAQNHLWERPGPKRFDIVVFKAIEPGVPKDTLVKRVIGLPGETILVRDGKVLIDGEPLELPASMPDVHYTSPFVYDKQDPDSPKYALVDEPRFTLIPEGHYFMLGDNSSSSRDARWWGPVPKRNILGRVTSVWWPFGRGRDFTGYTETIWWRGSISLLAVWTIMRLFVGRSWHLAHDPAPGAMARGERLFISKIALGFPVPFTGLRVTRGRTLRRGDVILFYPPQTSKDMPHLLAGTVAGLPGEHVHIRDGRLHVNGVEVEGPKWLAEWKLDPDGEKKMKADIAVPEASYFILAPDDDPAPDSRIFGAVNRSRVVGVATAVWWPLGRARRLSER